MVQQFKRQTAKKLRISDLASGSFEEREGLNVLITKSGEEVGRARVLATVVNKYISEDGNFASATLDDGTETIRVKGWKDVKNLEGLKVGDVIDVIGKVREYNGEIYLTNEIINVVSNPNMELLRRLELLKLSKSKPKGATEKKQDIRSEIVNLIEGSKEGIEYKKILETVKAKTVEIEAVIDDLLAGGICYEPSPGKMRKI